MKLWSHSSRRNLRYHWSLAETRANLAECYLQTAEYAQAIEAV